MSTSLPKCLCDLHTHKKNPIFTASLNDVFLQFYFHYENMYIKSYLFLPLHIDIQKLFPLQLGIRYYTYILNIFISYNILYHINPQLLPKALHRSTYISTFPQLHVLSFFSPYTPSSTISVVLILLSLEAILLQKID